MELVDGHLWEEVQHHDAGDDQVCYLIESDVEKGKVNILLMDDAFMDGLLKEHQELADQYHAVEKKKERQSAATIFPDTTAIGPGRVIMVGGYFI